MADMNDSKINRKAAMTRLECTAQRTESSIEEVYGNDYFNDLRREERCSAIRS